MKKSSYYTEQGENSKNNLLSGAIVVAIILLSLFGIYTGLKFGASLIDSSQYEQRVRQAVELAGHSCEGVKKVVKSSTAKTQRGSSVYIFDVKKFYVDRDPSKLMKNVNVLVGISQYGSHCDYFVEYFR